MIDVKLGTAGVDDSSSSQAIKLQGFDGKGDGLFTGAGVNQVDIPTLSGSANRIFIGSVKDVIYAGTRDVITGGSDDGWFNAEAGDGNSLSGGLGNDTFIICSSRQSSPWRCWQRLVQYPRGLSVCFALPGSKSLRHMPFPGLRTNSLGRIAWISA